MPVAGPGNDRIVATYPEIDMFIDCGGGDDTVTFNQEPPADLVINRCETVEVKSAG